MSRILWAKALVPPADEPVKELDYSQYFGAAAKVPGTRAIPTATEDFALPDPRAVRSMSRAAVMLANVCMAAQETLAPFLAKSPFSVGVYCAVENGPLDYPSTMQMLELTREQFAERYKRLRNPKMYLKQLPNLAGAQMGIFLNLMGKMDVYNHSTGAALQALDQAEVDLEQGRVDAALVCTGVSFEDPLLTLRAKKFASGGRILCEGAAGIILVKDEGSNGKQTLWDPSKHSGSESYYGIGHEIITLARENSKEN